MIKFADFIKATAYNNVEDKVKACIYNKNYEEQDTEEFIDIKMTIKNFIKYKDYIVTDIDACYSVESGSYLYAILEKPQ